MKLRGERHSDGGNKGFTKRYTNHSKPGNSGMTVPFIIILASIPMKLLLLLNSKQNVAFFKNCLRFPKSGASSLYYFFLPSST